MCLLAKKVEKSAKSQKFLIEKLKRCEFYCFTIMIFKVFFGYFEGIKGQLCGHEFD